MNAFLSGMDVDMTQVSAEIFERYRRIQQSAMRDAANQQSAIQEATRMAAEEMNRHSAYLEQERTLNNQFSAQLANDMVSVGRVPPLGDMEKLSLDQFRAMMNLYTDLWERQDQGGNLGNHAQQVLDGGRGKVADSVRETCDELLPRESISQRHERSNIPSCPGGDPSRAGARINALPSNQCLSLDQLDSTDREIAVTKFGSANDELIFTDRPMFNGFSHFVGF